MTIIISSSMENHLMETIKSMPSDVERVPVGDMPSFVISRMAIPHEEARQNNLFLIQKIKCEGKGYFLYQIM